MADDNFYSLSVGLVYLFNLLLGTGVLTMPAVFVQAGYISGIICLALLCFISYVQTTFLIESMANANFVKRMQHTNGHLSTELCPLLTESHLAEYNEEELIDASTHCNDQLYSKFYLESDEKALCTSSHNDDNTVYVIGENNPLPNDTDGQNQLGQKIEDIDFYLINVNHLDKKFNIVDKFELGNMTELFLNKYLSKFFFLSIISYLFGDLLIYNSMMSKSLRELSCTSNAYCSRNETNKHDDEHLDWPCWDNISMISRKNAYQIFLLGFISILGPLTYAKIQKTKNIQIMTIILRWIAFLSMIGITMKIFFTNQAKGHANPINLLNLPKLFGICVYSFMCHHSVPSIITPVKNKAKLYLGISIDYILVLTFYMIIALTAIFSFENIQQVYTLNFQIDRCSKNHSNPASIVGFDIFLPTFPIFTLFSSYTILALTLINNMKVLINFSMETENRRLIQYSLPLIAIIPPLAIALFTEDISSIVQYVGSYSGTLIQYVFPTLLVFYSRSVVKTKYLLPYIKHRMAKISNMKIDTSISNIDKIYRKLNPFASFFQSNFWIYFTAIWWILCLFLVTMDHLRSIFKFY